MESPSRSRTSWWRMKEVELFRRSDWWERGNAMMGRVFRFSL